MNRKLNITEDAKKHSSHSTARNWVILIALSAGCALYLAPMRNLGANSIPSTPLETLADTMGAILVLLSIPVLVSLAFKKSYRFAVRGAGLLVMFFISLIGGHMRARPAADFAKEAKAQHDEWRDDVEKEIKSQGFLETDLSKAEKNADALMAKANNLGGDEKVIVHSIMSVNGQLRELATRYEIASKSFSDAGGTDASTLNTLKEIESRKKLALEAQETSAAFLKFLWDIDARLASALSNAGISEQKAVNAIKAYRKSGAIDVILAIRELDVKLTEEILKVINLLEREFGKWRIEGNSVLFEQKSAADQFNVAGKRIDDLTKRQIELQKALIK